MADWLHDWRRVAAAVLVLAAGCGPGAKRGGYLLHPLPTAAHGYGLAGGALRYVNGPLEVELRPIDPRALDRDLSARGVPNPFPAGVDSPVLVFSLRMANRGKEVLYFNPAGVRGMDDGGGRHFPLGAVDVYGLHRDDLRREELVRAFGQVAFDTPVQIRPGEEVTRYLPLEAGGEVPATLAVLLQVRYGGEAGLALSFPFEAFPAEGATAAD
jgi:hypothetical protein